MEESPVLFYKGVGACGHSLKVSVMFKQRTVVEKVNNDFFQNKAKKKEVCLNVIK